MYAKTLSAFKQAQLEPILKKLETASEVTVTNPAEAVISSLRHSLYTWQSIQGCQGRFKIQQSKNKLQITNRSKLFETSKISVPETNLSEVEEIALELVDLTEDDIIEELHQNHKNQLENFPAILEECRRLQGREEKETREGE